MPDITLYSRRFISEQKGKRMNIRPLAAVLAAALISGSLPAAAENVHREIEA